MSYKLNSKSYSSKLYIKHLTPSRFPFFWRSPRISANTTFQVVGRKYYEIEYGPHLNPHLTRRWNIKLVATIAGLTIMLPLLWWLNSSKAFVESPVYDKSFLIESSSYLKNPRSLQFSPTSLTSLNIPSHLVTSTKVQPPLYPISSGKTKEAMIPALFSEELIAHPLFAIPGLSASQEASEGNLEIDSLHFEDVNNLSPATKWLHFTIETGDNLSQLFTKYHLNQAHLEQLLELQPDAKLLRQPRRHQQVRIKPDSQGNVKHLVLTLNASEELHFFQREGKFVAEKQPTGITADSEKVSRCGTVTNTLLDTARKIGLPKPKLAQLIDIFRSTIDIEHNTQKGDEFCLIYEQSALNAKAGIILAAEFIHNNQVYRALHYRDDNGYANYYTPHGDSLQRLYLLHAPLEEYTRISDPYGERRHPILKKYRFHTGVDYAAPWGTTILAAADGYVKLIGRKGGYGRVIILEHNPRVHTLYAHLSSYVANLKEGELVVQGQPIGYVGQSGRATGPHLHYEVQLDEQPIDPLLVEFEPLNMPIALENREHFYQNTQPWIAQLNTISSLTITQLAVKEFNPSPSNSRMTALASISNPIGTSGRTNLRLSR
jgi:murein DD-endopeptidase MepM/ murein hydrolase activator NlpD